MVVQRACSPDEILIRWQLNPRDEATNLSANDCGSVLSYEYWTVCQYIKVVVIYKLFKH